jgi:hypothetical protein
MDTVSSKDTPYSYQKGTLLSLQTAVEFNTTEVVPENAMPYLWLRGLEEALKPPSMNGLHYQGYVYKIETRSVQGFKVRLRSSINLAYSKYFHRLMHLKSVYAGRCLV